MEANCCKNCRHYQAVEQGIVDGLYLTNLMYEDGDCVLHGWEVTENFCCDDFELPPHPPAPVV